MLTLEATQDDITTLAVDAIVNAANERMLGGGGVDGAIHRAAGADLRAECERVPEVRPGVCCPTGEARITGGHALPAKHVIHTVGPVWSKERPEACDDMLRSCYRSSLALAEEQGLGSIAFPCISTGVYAFPAERAAKVAFRGVLGMAGDLRRVERVVFCCYSADDAAIYRDLLGGAKAEASTDAG